MKRNDQITDDMLDGEIESLLAVEPSPALLANVRARVAREPVSSAAWRFGRLLPIGATLAAVAVVSTMVSPMVSPMVSTVLWPRVDRTVRRDVVKPVAPAAEAEASVVSVPADLLGRPPVSKTVRPRVVSRLPERLDGVPWRRTASRQVDAGLEVLVSPDEARAFRLLLARIQQDRLPEFVVPDGAEQTLSTGPELPVPEAIRIRAVVIEPIAPLARIEGELQ